MIAGTGSQHPPKCDAHHIREYEVNLGFSPPINDSAEGLRVMKKLMLSFPLVVIFVASLVGMVSVAKQSIQPESELASLTRG